MRISRRSTLKMIPAMLAAWKIRVPLAALAEDEPPPDEIIYDEEDAYWRLEPLQPPDIEQFAADLESLTANRRRQLDDLVLERTIPELQQSLTKGAFTARELVIFYLARIRDYDLPRFHAVLEINPEAVSIASALDMERQSGVMRGPLHGIPILIKGNISTGDLMHTTAGAAALADTIAATDASFVERLRSAGAILLGKSNLSEWAYWMSSVGPSGFSALGGQVLSPYADWIDPIGSSTGSAVGVSLNLAACTVGTETIGSILAPSSRASVVGMHPTFGLVSQAGIIPITDEMDTAGPIGRTVTDVAMMLSVMADPVALSGKVGQFFSGSDLLASRLQPGALQGARIGFPTGYAGLPEEEGLELEGIGQAVDALRKAGAEIVVLPIAGDLPVDLYELEASMNTIMAAGVNQFFAHCSGGPATMAEVVAFNDADIERYAPFGQDRLWAVANPKLSEGEARAWAVNARKTVQDIWDEFFVANNLDAFVSIGSAYAFEIGLGGYPAITVPMGMAWDGAPYGLTLTGPRFTDAALLGYAYACEQASQLRQVPVLEPIV